MMITTKTNHRFDVKFQCILNPPKVLKDIELACLTSVVATG